MDKIEKKIDALTEVIVFIKDKMVTKEELHEELEPIKQDMSALKGKVDGVYNLIDQEVDRRKTLEVRTAKLEERASR